MAGRDVDVIAMVFIKTNTRTRNHGTETCTIHCKQLFTRNNANKTHLRPLA